MSVVISSSLTIADVISGGGVITADNPIIGYDNLVTTANISATTEDADFPAANLANPATHLKWQGLVDSPAADEYLTIDAETAELIDYVGIAGHNFYSGQIAVSLEILDASASPPDWVETVAPFIPPNDGPILMRFTPQAIAQIRVRLQPGTAAPKAAVVYCGALLVLQPRLYVGHTPMPYGRSLMTANPRSISGAFLGRIVLSEKTGTSIDLQNLTPAWYRTYMEPFLIAAKELPFFFAWRPSSYPYEVGYGWLAGDPKPVNQRNNGMMQVTLDLEGVV